MKTAFWVSLFIIFYTYFGYGLLLYILVRIKRLIQKPTVPEFHEDSLPSCTLIVAAYNEEIFIREKINNTLGLQYPEGKLTILFITDGSDDRTPEIIGAQPEIKLMHQPLRRGKVAALHRAVNETDTDILIFTDANTLLNRMALINIARHYADPAIGAVAGEKRVHTDDAADAGSAGEGAYWRYESTLKKWDCELYSTVGAAGELFSIRRELYIPVPEDTILDDFMISMLITAKGHLIYYEPDAYAIETASENITEELKRKIRIAAGGLQSIIRLAPLLNIFKYGILSFQYISHRVLRWTITPLLLIGILFMNFILVFTADELIYKLLFWGQAIFYLIAYTGFVLENKQLRLKILFFPYYFCVMNYAILAGFIRYLKKNQTAVWEKARRKT